MNYREINPRKAGKMLFQFAEFYTACEEGKKALWMGVDFVAMPRKYYEELVKQKEAETEREVSVDDLAQTFKSLTKGATLVLAVMLLAGCSAPRRTYTSSVTAGGVGCYCGPDGAATLKAESIRGK